jgi:hypothetical protein
MSFVTPRIEAESDDIGIAAITEDDLSPSPLSISVLEIKGKGSGLDIMLTRVLLNADDRLLMVKIGETVSNGLRKRCLANIHPS